MVKLRLSLSIDKTSLEKLDDFLSIRKSRKPTCQVQGNHVKEAGYDLRIGENVLDGILRHGSVCKHCAASDCHVRANADKGSEEVLNDILSLVTLGKSVCKRSDPARGTQTADLSEKKAVIKDMYSKLGTTAVKTTWKNGKFPGRARNVESKKRQSPISFSSSF
jgi:hypothetical protein